MSEQAIGIGPALASTDDMAPVELPRAWAWKFKWLLPAIHAGISILFVAGLWQAGYPGWRTAAIGVLLAANWIRNVAFKQLVLPRMAKPAPACTGPSMAAWMFGMCAQFAIVGLSGGLRSPFLIAIMGPLSGMLVKFGWSRETKRALRIIAIGAAALILLPAAWVGPQVAAPWFARLAGLTLFAAIFLHTSYLIAMTRALNESHARSDRARERMAQDALSRARELEQMTAQLSHELKNPLGAIKALVQLSRRDACDEASRERLEVAENEVERMNGILQEYLSFSRPLDRLRRERLMLGALADEVLELLGAQASGAGVSLKRLGESEVEADPRRLREALFNLVANAIDATPAGGSVEVRVLRRDGAAEVVVHDSGRGMTREVLDRVGTPFFTTRDQGTGLGVAMARAAFAQHGGSLRYASEEGRGTTATGVLPLNPERSALVTAAAG